MKWQTLAGPKHTYSTLVENGDGRLELFALTGDGDLQHCWQKSPSDSAHWSEWHQLGRGEWDQAGPGSFTVALDNKGCLQLFLVANGTAPGAQGQVFHCKQRSPGLAGTRDSGAGEWSEWHTLDGRHSHGWSTTVGPSVVRDADGQLNLFVMSANRGVLEENWWSDYTNSTGIGHYQENEDGSWSGPELRLAIETCIEMEGRPDYTCTSKLPVKLASALNSDGRLELFANAGDMDAKRRGVPGTTHIPAYLWHARQTREHSKNWSSGDLSMPPLAAGDVDTGYDGQATQPAVVLGHEGNLELYVWGNSDHHIWLRKQDPSVEGRWLPWSNLGGSEEWTCPVVVGDRDNMLTVLATNAASGTMWYLAQALDGGGQAVWPEEWQLVRNDVEAGATPAADSLQAITNRDGCIELFASGPDNTGFFHMSQNAPGKWD
jgi:hypothetical protein